MQKIDIINTDKIANDISSLVDHIALLTTKDKEWFSKVYFREVIKFQHYDVQSQDESATQVKYVGSQEFLDNARYILDWLAGLQEREPKQHSKLPRITFQQALGHSKKWHAELAKKAEQSDRYIEPDAENAPKVLDLGDGWEVFWLKTKIAKEAEGDAMGHCVGSSGYDNLRKGEEVFSIRKNNVAHITLHMEELRIKQAATKGNGDVPDRYQYLIYNSTAIIGSRFLTDVSLEDQSPIPDGWNRNRVGDKIRIENGIVNSNGDDPAIIKSDGTQMWLNDGRLHRLDGPSVIDADGTQEWFKDGKKHREDGPAVIKVNGTQIWFENGKRHREDGPAVIREDGRQEWYRNGLLHRLDGPAIMKNDVFLRKYGKEQEWWVDGKEYTENKFNDLFKNMAASPM